MGIKEYIHEVLLEISPDYRSLIGGKSTFYGTFIRQTFKWLVSNLKKNTIAVDIGAYIGDSAIYLAMQKDVKQIYSYEPYLSLYKKAKANIKVSGYGNKIKLFNQAVSSNNGWTILEEEGHISSVLERRKKGKKTKITSLQSILKGKKNVIIKSNCEGWEHDIFGSKSKLDLQNVYKMQIAYHNGLQNLEKNIRAFGFKTRSVETEYDKKLGRMGTIYAWK